MSEVVNKTNTADTQTIRETASGSLEEKYTEIKYSQLASKLGKFLDYMGFLILGLIDGKTLSLLKVKFTKKGKRFVSIFSYFDEYLRKFIGSIALPDVMNIKIDTYRNLGVIKFENYGQISRYLFSTHIKLEKLESFTDIDKIKTKLQISVPSTLLNNNEICIICIPDDIVFNNPERKSQIERELGIEDKLYDGKSVFWDNLANSRQDLYYPPDWTPSKLNFVILGKLDKNFYIYRILQNTPMLKDLQIYDLNGIEVLLPTSDDDLIIFERTYSASTTILDTGNNFQAEAESDLICFYGRMYLLRLISN